MSYSLSNGRITQSGTDADLSGLAGINGVGVFTTGGGSTGKVYYNLNNLSLVITGTQNHDPEEEVLIGNNGAAVQANQINTTIYDIMLTIMPNAVYNYGVERVQNGEIVYSESTGIVSTFLGLNVFGSVWLEVKQDGTLNWNGGDIEYASVIYIREGAIINQNAGGFTYKNPNNNAQIRIENTTQATADVVNFNDIRVAAPNGTNPVFFTRNTWGALSATAVCMGYQTSLGFVSGTTDLENYANGRNSADTDVIYNGGQNNIYKVFYTNVERELSAKPLPGFGERCGLIATRKQFDFTFEDRQGNAVSPVVYYAEQDDGNTSQVEIYDLTVLDKFAEQSASGFLSTKIECVYTYKLFGNNNPVVINKRYNQNDSVSFAIWEYSKQYKPETRGYYGLAAPSVVNVVLFDDELVTLSETAVVGLTQINTLDELYDAAKYWKTRPQTERIEYPATDAQLATLTGTALDLGDSSLVVDENATDAFSVDIATDTITIKSSALEAGDKFDSILTTGTATGSINTPIIDANGDSFVEEAQGRLIRVYSSAPDRDSRINPLTAGLVSRYRFTFASRPANTLYLWVQVGDAEYPAQVTLEQGENIVDLGIASQLVTAIDGQRVINQGVQKSSLIIPHTIDI